VGILISDNDVGQCSISWVREPDVLVFQLFNIQSAARSLNLLFVRLVSSKCHYDHNKHLSWIPFCCFTQSLFFSHFFTFHNYVQMISWPFWNVWLLTPLSIADVYRNWLDNW
jgi:hypothetical protein